MKLAVLIGILAVLATADISVQAQLPQQERMKRRIDQSIRANTARDGETRDGEEGRLPEPKAAVMNIDVQMVLSRSEHKIFADAKLAEAKKVADGDPLWLYIKFKTRLGDYVKATRDPIDPEKIRYTLFVEIAPAGDVTALYQYVFRFAKEDLSLNEIKVNLAPGMFGRNKSLPVLLTTSANAKSGVWNNEFRLTNKSAIPRELNDNLATARITLDFSTGNARYRKMNSEYSALILRGSTDPSKPPVAGTFYNDALNTRITEKLAAENIKPVKVYFSGDDWQEFAVFGLSPARTRTVYATFTYMRDAACYYGVAEITENFDHMQSKFADADIRLQKDFAVPCSEI